MNVPIWITVVLGFIACGALIAIERFLPMAPGPYEIALLLGWAVAVVWACFAALFYKPTEEENT